MMPIFSWVETRIQSDVAFGIRVLILVLLTQVSLQLLRHIGKFLLRIDIQPILQLFYFPGYTLSVMLDTIESRFLSRFLAYSSLPISIPVENVTRDYQLLLQRSAFLQTLDPLFTSFSEHLQDELSLHQEFVHLTASMQKEPLFRNVIHAGFLLLRELVVFLVLLFPVFKLDLQLTGIKHLLYLWFLFSCLVGLFPSFPDLFFPLRVAGRILFQGGTVLLEKLWRLSSLAISSLNQKTTSSSASLSSSFSLSSSSSSPSSTSSLSLAFSLSRPQMSSLRQIQALLEELVLLFPKISRGIVLKVCRSWFTSWMNSVVLFLTLLGMLQWGILLPLLNYLVFLFFLLGSHARSLLFHQLTQFQIWIWEIDQLVSKESPQVMQGSKEGVMQEPSELALSPLSSDSSTLAGSFSSNSPKTILIRKPSTPGEVLFAFFE